MVLFCHCNKFLSLWTITAMTILLPYVAFSNKMCPSFRRSFYGDHENWNSLKLTDLNEQNMSVKNQDTVSTQMSHLTSPPEKRKLWWEFCSLPSESFVDTVNKPVYRVWVFWDTEISPIADQHRKMKSVLELPPTQSPLDHLEHSQRLRQVI